MSQWWIRAIASGCMVLALGCASQSTNIKTAEQTDSQIRLHVETPSEGVRLVIDGDNPLVYTAFRLPDPPRLVIDLAGTSLAPDQQPIQVDHGSVTTIRPTAATTGSHTTRIEVGLTQLVDYQLQPNGSKLLVMIANPASSTPAQETADASPTMEQESASSAPTPSPADTSLTQPAPTQQDRSSVPPAADEPAATPDQDQASALERPAPASAPAPLDKIQTTEAPSAAPPAQNESPSMPESDATIVTGVHVDRIGDQLVIAIEGNGRFHPSTMLLSGPRLVIDLPGTTARVRSRVAVNKPPLAQIRVGKHQTPKMVRIVFDLTRPVTYQLTQETGKLIVSMTASSSAQSEAIMTDKLASKTASLSPPAAAAAEQAPLPVAPAAPVAKDTPPPASGPPQVKKSETTENAKPPLVKAPAKQPSSTGKEVVLPSPKLRKKTVNAQMSSSGSANGQSSNASIGGEKQFTGRLISLDFQDADLDNVLRLMSDVSGLNIVVGGGVKGKVTLKLLNVPWDQALDLILRSNGLGQVRDGNILRIDTLGNLAKQQDEEAKAKDSAKKAEELITKVMYVNYADAKKLMVTMQKNLSPRGEITYDERTNALIVKDIRQNIDEVTALLKVLDRKTPQVLIEARIVEADTNFARDLGVQWGASFSTTQGPYQFGTQTGPSSPTGPTGLTGATGIGPGSSTTGFLVNLPASGQAGPLGSLGFTLGKLTGSPFSLDLRLSAGENQGVSKTISAPKVMVLDNQKAKIQQGTSIPFQSGATSASGPTTIFVDASLTLEVTPHVTPDGSISMDLRVADDQPDYINNTPAGPPIRKKEAKTIIMIKDGDTIVLGGIYIATNSDSMNGLPWLNKIPFFGWLFKEKSHSSSNTELLVFLTPKIVT
jgi:type IV pilus assembly protein PilQ